jgi:peroxiredoxin (alkyl hydroperoxide reductase subunit C)
MSVNAGDVAPVVTVEAYVRDEAQPVEVEVGGPAESWTVLFFYPRDFTFLCPAELRGFAELQAAFALEGASVMAASTDSWHVHRAWLETSSGLTGIRYPVLADPAQELIRAYGVLDVEDGSALPATFIIDPSGTVRDMSIAGPGTRHRPEETLETLRELRISELQAVA